MQGLNPALLILTLIPIAVILVMLIIWKKPADISGIVGWLAISIVAFFFFSTSFNVIWRSTLAGFIRSFSVSLMVAASLLQVTFMEKTGSLKRIVILIKTIASDNRAVQIMLINIGFGTLMVAVGQTPVSLLPPILIAMGYGTYAAIALPAIGYDSLCTYALLGAPIVVFVDLANSFLGKGHEITLSQAGHVFWMFLPIVSTLIGFSMLWIVGKWKDIKQGWLPCIITGATILVVSYFTNSFDNIVCLTGVFSGAAVIVVMCLYLALSGKKIIDKSKLTKEELAYEKRYPLWRALMPLMLLVFLILILNVPKSIFNLLYYKLLFPVTGLTANNAPIATRWLWSAYTWVVVSTLLAIPFMRTTGGQVKDTLKTWGKRAYRPTFSTAIFFAIGEIMNMTGYNTLFNVDKKAPPFLVPSMVKVLADYSAATFHQAYGGVVGFIGLLGGFITGSETSAIAMFSKYTMTTGKELGWGLRGMIILTAGMAFGSGLASVISPAKLQNAAASIDKVGEETKVIRVAFVFSIFMTLVTSAFVLIFLATTAG
jgi:lactate permease